MKNILLDATTLMTPKSGIGFYVEKIAKELIAQKDFNPSFFLDHYFSSNLIEFKKKRDFITKILMKSVSLKYSFLSKKIRNFTKKNRISLFHQPNFITYETGIKNITTVHDFSWYHYPNYFLKDELKLFDNYFEKSLKLSSKIIVHSNFVKKELINLFHFPKENIHIVYEDLRKDFINLDRNECKDFLQKYKLEYKKFFLILNTLELRKNYKMIIKVYNHLDEKIKNNYPLIISGMPGRCSEVILNLIQNTKNCYYIGYLDEKYLNQCYSAAKLFFYPSIYEGFGISPLESMACGTPVISSNTAVAGEILQQSSINIDPQNIDLWISKIKEMVLNDDLYQHYLYSGLEWSKKYQRGSTVTAILNLYREVLGIA